MMAICLHIHEPRAGTVFDLSNSRLNWDEGRVLIDFYKGT